MKHKALGKGLRSLIPEAPRRTPPEPIPALAARAATPQIDIDRIVPNRRQPRDQFDDEALEALSNSLKIQGVLQPVLVRPLPDGTYGLIAGERRWRAAQRAGLLKIPAVIREVPDERLLEFALIENLQREELNPLEEARAYRTLIDELGLTQQQVAERVGKQRATVANAMRILTLPEPVQGLIRSRRLSMAHARALASLESAPEQNALAERVVRDGLSVRAVEAEVTRLQKAKTMAGMAVRATTRKDPNVAAAEESLQRAIGTKVRIYENRKGSGRIEIHFFTTEERDGVYESLMRLKR